MFQDGQEQDAEQKLNGLYQHLDFISYELNVADGQAIVQAHLLLRQQALQEQVNEARIIAIGECND